MNNEILMDSLGAQFICDGGMLECYDRLYPEVNEDLVDIYLDLDFEDKDVLSVVSSSDQIYTPKLLGARRVDGFDRNRLTKYYYYLRRWAIKYNNQMYPYGVIDGDRDYLNNLLKKVEVNNKKEKDALEFWERLHEKEVKLNNLFYDDYVNKGQTLFSNSINYLKDICSDDLNFYNIDFFDNLNSSKKYDYIMMSNIIEYCRGDINKLKTIRNNLFNLLKDNGKVICSRLIYKRCGFNDKELDVFDEAFYLRDYGPEEGYTYIKKC